MRLRLSAVLLAAFISSHFLPVAARGQAPAAATESPLAYLADTRFKEAFAEGQQASRRHQFSAAIDGYKKANKIAEGKCFECLDGIWSAQISEAEYKQASTTAIAMEMLATDAHAKSMAEFLHAETLYSAAGEKPKSDKLEAVHTLLQESIGNHSKNAAALFLDGKVLARLGKMEEAKAEFVKCVSCANPKDPSKLHAEHFAENPELALHRMAPSFAVAALDGTQFNLDAMGGRVVLIDFWATWCGPCKAELPHVKKIAQEFAGQPLVILSVSWDADDAKWKDFVAKNGMTWMQYRDTDHKLSEQFGVNAIPHYFTIDSDGVLTAEMLGEGSDVEGKLRKLLAKTHAAPKETVSRVPIQERTAGN